MSALRALGSAIAGGLALAAAGCTDYDLGTEGGDGLPGSDDDTDPYGADGNPDFDGIPWDDCRNGYLARYFNLPAGHPDVEIEVSGVSEGDHPANHDWWDDTWLAWEQYDEDLDFGAPWWPVDQGWEGDPQYFAVHWSAWIVVHEAAPFTFEMGSDDDSWLLVNGQVLVDLGGIHGLAATSFEAVLDEGWYAFDLYFAERHTVDSGFWFRFTGGPVTVYPSDCDDHP